MVNPGKFSNQALKIRSACIVAGPSMPGVLTHQRKEITMILRPVNFLFFHCIYILLNCAIDESELCSITDYFNSIINELEGNVRILKGEVSS